jgi:geranylgeranyl diphosphate synthase type II
MFDLDSYLNMQRGRTDEFLRHAMPSETTRPARLHAAMRYSLFGGGKRIRPILALAACDAVGGNSETALRPASAIELLHTYTLIHDDLPAMDDDKLRRGRATCHIAFDEATAILAGDALLTLAFQWLAGSRAPPPFSAADYVRELAVAAGSEGVIGGQIEDICAEGKPHDAELLDYIHTHKTGDLIVASVRIGGIAGGADPAQLEKLSACARAAGLAFQIADDILNATATAEQLGKAVGTDAARGKLTYVSVHGIEDAKRRADALVSETTAMLEDFGTAAEPLRALTRHIVSRKN